MRILLTGGSGKLGRQLLKRNPDLYAPSHKDLDITNRKLVNKVISDYNPEVIIHLAAETDVVKCEAMRDYAWRVNVEGTRNLLNACYNDVYFVYVSTACVFKGDKNSYCELDVPYPCNFYGLTKLVAESLVRYRLTPLNLVIRTNFIDRGKWPYPKAFVDRYANYLYTDELADKILWMVTEERTGLLHLFGEKMDSMYGFAIRSGRYVEPITLEDYYSENPCSPRLTRNMTLGRVRP